MADNRGRDGGFRGGRKFEKTDRKPGFGGEKRSFGDKKSFAPRSGKPSFDDKKSFAPRGDKPSFGEKKGFAPHGDKPAFGEKRGTAPRPVRPERPAKPKPMNLAPRRVALETLLDVSRSDAYASLALDKRLAQAAFGRRDRAFTTQLVYGTLENRIALDWRIDQFLEGEKEIEPAVREILRMGAYQLFYLDRVPDMAAVDESVSLTRAMGFEGFTGLVNAVLRNMIRGKENVVWPKPQDDPAKYLSVMFSAPMDLAQLLIEAYG